MEYRSIFYWYVLSCIWFKNVEITTILADVLSIFQAMDYSAVLWAWALFQLFIINYE